MFLRFFPIAWVVLCFSLMIESKLIQIYTERFKYSISLIFSKANAKSRENLRLLHQIWNISKRCWLLRFFRSSCIQFLHYQNPYPKQNPVTLLKILQRTKLIPNPRSLVLFRMTSCRKWMLLKWMNPIMVQCQTDDQFFDMVMGVGRIAFNILKGGFCVDAHWGWYFA